MLIKCPECEVSVSDKAIACPHCGYPLKKGDERTYNKKKRMRLPNGFGQISEIKNANLRKPFRAMITVGVKDDGKPICKLLKPEAYFKTYNEAYEALMKYHKSPYDIETEITVQELYIKWSEVHFKEIDESTAAGVKSCWKYASSLYEMKVREVKTRHLKQCVETAQIIKDGNIKLATAAIKHRLKGVLNKMFDFAVEYELIDKNYARDFKLAKETMKEYITPKTSHIPFTDDEMNVLWSNLYIVPFVDIILIQCYSGWRPGEIGQIKLNDYNPKEQTFKGGAKTENGKNRVVPIHPRIKTLVERHHKEAIKRNSEWLFNYIDMPTKRNDLFISYARFIKGFNDVVKKLSLMESHRPHDGRKHFVTMAKKNKMDEYAIKYLVGHSITDITEKVYTERDVDWLRNEMAKIP